MINKHVVTIVFVSVCLASVVHAGTGGDDSGLEAYRLPARTAAMEFANALKAELKNALEHGSVTGAIEVCHTRARALAAEYSERRGLSIRRVSGKTRNPANEPDPWEREQLTRAEESGARPEEVLSTELSGDADHAGEGEVRYLKYIYTEPLCLTCHGEAIDPSIRAVLDRLYPDDQATGYRLDDLRGAISVRFPAGSLPGLPKAGNP